MEFLMTITNSDIWPWVSAIMAISAIIVTYMAYCNWRLVNFLADLAIARVEASRASRILDSSSRICDSFI